MRDELSQKAQDLLIRFRIEFRKLKTYGRRVFPKSLMLRYSIALFSLAALIALEQFVVQLTLRTQGESQKLMRQADRQNLEASRLAKLTLAAEFANRDSDIRDQLRAVNEVVTEFKDGHNALISSLNEFRSGWLGASIREEQADVETAFSAMRLSDTVWSKPLKNPSSSKLRYALRAEMPKLRAATAEYKKSLETALISLDQVNQDQVRSAKRIEFCLFGLLILVLFLEGFYIFRPSIRGLEGALRTRSDFMSRMSHEIRNPMNAIMGMTDVMRETPLSDLQKQYLNTLDRSSKTLLELLNSLLDFSELENGKTKVEKVRFNLLDILHKAVDICAVRAHEKNLEIILDIDPMTPVNVTGDPTRLQQVVSNLLSNAVKFTERGEVRLHVQPEIQGGYEQYLSFSVVDTGIGIRPQSLAMIFESFVQAESSTRRKYGGTGLGLTISKELVCLMGGQLRVESEPGKGSKFHFALPVGTPSENSLTLKDCLKQHDLSGTVVLILGKRTTALNQAAQAIELCGGRVESSIEAVDLNSPQASVLVAPQEDESMLQFFPERFPSSARIICLLPTVVSPAKMRSFLSFGINEFVLAPFKTLEFVETLMRGRKQPPLVPNEEPRESADSFRILVADDSSDNREMIRLYLGREKIKIDFAVDGAQAIQKFQTGQYDLVLMDIQMPVLDGTEAFFSIREWEISNEKELTPIVAVTADDRAEQKSALLQLGFSSLMMKPFKKRELLDLVHRYRGSRFQNVIELC